MTAPTRAPKYLGREECVAMLRTPGAYLVSEMNLTYWYWLKRPGHPDQQVSKAVVGWVRDRYPLVRDGDAMPWRWILKEGA